MNDNCTIRIIDLAVGHSYYSNAAIIQIVEKAQRLDYLPTKNNYMQPNQSKKRQF